eukprot:TRINITY_DN6386_c3_g1_i1.p1 TRINITY_DN6386_c3_g1~~TRINITY_DN6386_c3_g1_i1.p1  ORF type:complete len:779 (+),score=120.29 TRINITY_DN6386_c3_g1_i1:103-2439(+)
MDSSGGRQPWNAKCGSSCNATINSQGLQMTMRPLGLENILDLEEMIQSVEKWVTETGDAKVRRDILIGCCAACAGVVALVLGHFMVMVPGMYALGGMLLYRNQGGRRFVALAGAAWAMFVCALAIQVANLWLRDSLLHFNSIMISALSFVLMLGALFLYRSPNRKKADEGRERYVSPSFNADLQHSVLMRSADYSPSFCWWIFVGMQSALVICVSIVLTVGAVSTVNPTIRVVTILCASSSLIGALATTHALGGKWRYIESSYAAFMPFRGGFSFVALQVAGWSFLGVFLTVAGAALADQASVIQGGTSHMPNAMALMGILGIVSESFILASLFYFQDDAAASSSNSINTDDSAVNVLLKAFVSMQVHLLNKLFGPADPYGSTRDPIQRDPHAHLRCEEKWARVTAHCSKATGDCYLVVGNGFIGKRLVNSLLNRGETNIRVFDIVLDNPWKGDQRVSFYQGDVTKPDQIGAACEGVDTVYATFAVIRFMDRLEHQASLSYHVNVTGTEILLSACQAYNVKRLVVTSSSHATMDANPQPAFGRDETAKYVAREDAHNHYCWTKALADEMSLKADGRPLAAGGELAVTVVRPCSGVFGADDRLCFEKVLDLGFCPAVGPKTVFDWVYADNVVLGHILAETALQDGRPGVRGQAFCISNGDPVSMENFWMLTQKHVDLLPSRAMRKRLVINFFWIPQFPIWALAYIVEFIQRISKGKVSLGRDVELFTPAMLTTMHIQSSYKIDKASRVLGYEPVFTLDEAIQRCLRDYYEARYGSIKDD